MSITFEMPDLTQWAAWIGAITGAVALIWQIANWRRLSHNVKVSSSNAWAIYGDVLGDDMIAVTARNLGTTAVTITGWGVSVGSENAIMTAPVNYSTPLPHRLEPGAEAIFHMPSASLRQRQMDSGEPFRRMRPWVRLATGQRIFSRKGLPLAL